MTDYGIKRFNRYSDEELLDRLLELHKQTQSRFLSARAFSAASGISEGTITTHFGSWKAFCQRAGLAPRYDRTEDKTDLLQNLAVVWEALGRQPRAKEMKQPVSAISLSRYNKVFGLPWYRVCLEFLAWKSGESVADISKTTAASEMMVPEKANGHRTRRNMTLSMRYEILKRNGFRCVRCGRSPATEKGVQLHVDHIKAWANGGETVLDNLQTLCSDCNLGKSDKFG